MATNFWRLLRRVMERSCCVQINRCRAPYDMNRVVDFLVDFIQGAGAVCNLCD